MEMKSCSDGDGWCEGVLASQNYNKVLSFEEKTSPFAAFVKERTCMTPVCGESFDENRGACKESYTGFPVDVNKVCDGTLGADILTIKQDKSKEGSPCKKSSFEVHQEERAQHEATSKEYDPELNNIGCKQGKKERIVSVGKTVSMVDLRFKEDAKTSTGLKANCNDVKINDSQREETSTKGLEADFIDATLDVNLDNLLLLENHLSYPDGNFNTKREQIDGYMFDSFSFKQNSYSCLSTNILPNESTHDFTPDFTSDLASYLGTFSAPNNNGENGAVNLSTNPDQIQQGLRTDEILLLKEALRTKSFVPIAYLLSILTKGSSGCLSGTSSASGMIPRSDIRSPSDDEVSIVSSLSDKSRRLSSQESYDSDHSSVLSDGRFGKRFSECDLSDLLGSGAELQNVDEQSIDFLTLEQDTHVNAVKNEEMTDSSTESDVVTVISSIFASDSACDLQLFKELLEKDGVETTPKSRMFTKIWKEASTNTNQSLETERYKNENNILEDQMLIDSQADIDQFRICKQPSPRVGPNRCYHLWDFLKELLDNECSNVVVWTDQSKNEFKLLDTKLLAELWGQKKKLPNMNYDKLSRSLRYYIKLDILRKVPGKRLHFQFGKGRMWKKMKK